MTLQVLAQETALDRLSEVELLARLPALDQCWEQHGDDWVLDPVAAELGRRAENGLLSDEGWRAALLAADVFHTRARWPKDVPLQVWIREPPWLSRTRIVAQALEPDIGRIEADRRHPSWCGNCLSAEEERLRELGLAEIPGGTSSVTFDVTIELLQGGSISLYLTPRGSGGPEVQRMLWRGRLQIPVAIVDSVEDCLPQASGAELDAAVRQAVSLSWWKTQANPAPEAQLYAFVDPTQQPVLARIGVSFEAEVLHAGQVVEHLTLCVSDAAQWAHAPDSAVRGNCLVNSLPPEDDLQGAELASWEVRVCGTWKGLLSLWEAERWWQGEFTVPLAELLDRGR